jgi:hypothetical protein
MILNPMFTKQNLETPMGNEKDKNTKRHFNTKLVAFHFKKTIARLNFFIIVSTSNTVVFK